jgi:S1-C subfamily serine protease
MHNASTRDYRNFISPVDFATSRIPRLNNSGKIDVGPVGHKIVLISAKIALGIARISEQGSSSALQLKGILTA